MDRKQAEQELSNANQVQQFAMQNLMENLLMILGKKKFWELCMFTTGEEVLIELSKMEVNTQ